MSKENFKGGLKDFIQSSNENEMRKKQNIEYILFDKTLIYIKDYEIAKIIVEWCKDEEEPAQFFLKCLEKMGIEVPVKIVHLSVMEDYYSFIIAEMAKQKIWQLKISKIPKAFLKLEIMFSEKIKGVFKCNYFELSIKEEKVKIKYCNEKTIIISIGKDIHITLTGINWEEKEKLYDISKKLIKDLKMINESLEPYKFYTKSKEKIEYYYDLKNVEIELIMKRFSVVTKNGKIISYCDYKKGITIKNYDKWEYKEYQTETVRLLWECGRFKCSGIPNKDIQKYVDMVEKMIKEIESLKF